MNKICIVCGAEYKAPPSDKRSTCGTRECVIENKRRTHRGKSNKWSKAACERLRQRGKTANLDKGTAAALESPFAGPFETNHNAIIWHLIAPDGERITCRNLSLWLRNNRDRLDGTPEQARAGIMAMKQWQTGKRKRPVTQWKGWQLEGWEKNMICPHCEKSISKKISHPLVLADLEKQAAKAMAQIQEAGLDAWLERRKCSQYRLAKLLTEAAGEVVSKTTVNSQIKRGNITPLMRAAIRGLVISGKL